MSDKNCKEPKKGYIYCLYNEMFNFYGKNVYKLGETNNIKKRLNSYTTNYIKKSEIILLSKELPNKKLAEKILFSLLNNHRICKKREFFDCELEKIKEAINKVENIFDNNEYENENKNIIKAIINKDNNKINYLKQFLDNDTIKMDEYNKMLKDEKAFITFINKNYLKMSKKEFNEHKAKANNNELLEFINKNNLYKKIDGLFLLENMLKINRYAINDISKDIDIKKITKRLIKQVDKLSVFAGDNLSNNKCKNIIINRIKKISHYDQLQKFIADCYNLFGKIILFDKRIIKINKKNITKYFNFR